MAVHEWFRVSGGTSGARCDTRPLGAAEPIADHKRTSGVTSQGWRYSIACDAVGDLDASAETAGCSAVGASADSEAVSGLNPGPPSSCVRAGPGRGGGRSVARPPPRPGVGGRGA